MSKWSALIFLSFVIFLMKMAPKTKKSESIIEFYKLRKNKGHCTLKSNGKGLTCLAQQSIGFGANLIKKAPLPENLALEVLLKSVLKMKKS